MVRELKKKNSNPSLKVIFITLFIGNIIAFLSWVQYLMASHGSGSILIMLPLLLSYPVLFLDLVAATFYIITQHTQSKFKSISFTVLIMAFLGIFVSLIFSSSEFGVRILIFALLGIIIAGILILI